MGEGGNLQALSSSLHTNTCTEHAREGSFLQTPLPQMIFRLIRLKRIQTLVTKALAFLIYNFTEMLPLFKNYNTYNKLP